MNTCSMTALALLIGLSMVGTACATDQSMETSKSKAVAPQTELEQVPSSGSKAESKEALIQKIRNIAAENGTVSLDLNNLTNRTTKVLSDAKATKLSVQGSKNASTEKWNQKLRLIGQLKELRELDLRNQPISDLGPLANLDKLEVLHIEGAHRVRDNSPLENLKNLKELYIETAQVPSIILDKMKAANPDLIVKVVFPDGRINFEF